MLLRLALLSLGLVATRLGLVATRLVAQTEITFVQLAKTQSFSQTGLNSAAVTTLQPFHFYLGLQGTGLDAYPRTAGTPDITLSYADSSRASYLPVALTTADHSANQTGLIAREWDFTSAAALNAQFPNTPWATEFYGRYWNSANYYSIYNSEEFVTDLYPNMPIFTNLNQGTFSGNTYYVDPSQALVFNSNIFTTNFLAGTTRVSIQIEDLFGNRIASAETTTGDSLSLSLTAASLIAGSEYLVKLEFDRSVEFTAQAVTRLHSDGLISMDDLRLPIDSEAIYSTYTTMSLVAIPEPSTYALLAGLGTLSLALWRHRRGA